MAVVVTDAGVQLLAALVPPTWYGAWLIGLFRNDLVPGHGSTLASIEPANFSGYIGLRVLSVWSAPTWDGVRATTTGPTVDWNHNGGPIQGRVYGYYVQTPGGVLLWAKRVDPPVWLTSAGQTYRAIPKFTWRSEF